jgi:hypothetical protein
VLGGEFVEAIFQEMVLVGEGVQFGVGRYQLSFEVLQLLIHRPLPSVVVGG